jgi:hypothetical protein
MVKFSVEVGARKYGCSAALIGTIVEKYLFKYGSLMKLRITALGIKLQFLGRG